MYNNESMPNVSLENIQEIMQCVDLNSVRPPDTEDYPGANRYLAFKHLIELPPPHIGQQIDPQAIAKGNRLYAGDVSIGTLALIHELVFLVDDKGNADIDPSRQPKIKPVLMVSLPRFNSDENPALWYRSYTDRLFEHKRNKVSNKVGARSVQVSGPFIEMGIWAQRTVSTGKVAVHSTKLVNLWHPQTAL